VPLRLVTLRAACLQLVACKHSMGEAGKHVGGWTDHVHAGITTFSAGISLVNVQCTVYDHGKTSFTSTQSAGFKSRN